MSVKKEPSGRRSIQVEVEAPGTPEEVWQAIASGPGISAWFVPAEFEERDGKPVAVTLNFGPGMDSRSVVTAWDPPRMFVKEAAGWFPGSPPIATEWSVEARAGGRLRRPRGPKPLRQHGRLGRATHRHRIGLARLLPHLADLSQALPRPALRVHAIHGSRRGNAGGSLGDADRGNGVQRSGCRDRIGSVPPGLPALGGVVESVGQDPPGALLRLDRPGPGTAALYTMKYGGSVMAMLSFYLYGEDPAGTAARETPLWQAWLGEHFPT